LADADKALAIGPPTASLTYATAALYARAAGKMDASGERKRRSDLLTRAQYQDQAITLLGQATRLLPEDQRAPFWRDTVLRDGALAPVRNCVEFARLRRRYSPGDSVGHPLTSPGNSFGVRPPS